MKTLCVEFKVLKIEKSIYFNLIDVYTLHKIIKNGLQGLVGLRRNRVINITGIPHLTPSPPTPLPPDATPFY